MSEWAKLEVKYACKCEICGTKLPEGSHALGARIGPVSGRTGQPTWVFHCDSCHKTFEPAWKEMTPPEVSDDLVEELKSLAEAAAGDTHAGIIEGTMGTQPVPPVVPRGPRPNTLEYIKQNALWG